MIYACLCPKPPIIVVLGYGLAATDCLPYLLVWSFSASSCSCLEDMAVDIGVGLFNPFCHASNSVSIPLDNMQGMGRRGDEQPVFHVSRRRPERGRRETAVTLLDNLRHCRAREAEDGRYLILIYLFASDISLLQRCGLLLDAPTLCS